MEADCVLTNLKSESIEESLFTIFASSHERGSFWWNYENIISEYWKIDCPKEFESDILYTFWARRVKNLKLYKNVGAY